MFPMSSRVFRHTRFISFGFALLASLTAPGLSNVSAADPGSTSAAAAAAAASVTSPTNGLPTAIVKAAIVAPGETTVTLDINFGIRFVPAARVAVPAGELLRVSAPNLGPLQWLKDGKPITGATNATLVIDSVQSSDAGVYSAVYTDPAMAGRGSQAMFLSVGPGERLLNLSTRAQLAAGPGQSVLAGFVVAGGSGSGKRIILRAVGPTLSTFGITNPLKLPALRVLDARGKPYENGYVYPAVVGGPTYETDLAACLARCGAFPIPAGTADVTLMMPFVPGNYVVEVTSRDETAGTVLLEIYEVP
jgi:hypothetical protein